MSLALAEEPLQVHVPTTTAHPSPPTTPATADSPQPSEDTAEERSRPLPQWIYIQAPAKLPAATTTTTTTTTPLQIIAPAKTITVPISSQNLLLAGKPKHVLIQKQPPPGGGGGGIPLVSTSSAVPKNTLALITMVKGPKCESNPLIPSAIQIGSISKIKGAAGEGLKVVVSTVAASPLTSLGQKVVIAPMPKMASNRLAATATTNATKTRITLLPLPAANSIKPKLFNVSVIGNQLDAPIKSPLDAAAINWPDSDVSEQCTGDVICLDSPKTPIADQTYELSIPDNAHFDQEANGGRSNSLSEEERPRNLAERIRQGAIKVAKQGVSLLKKNAAPCESSNADNGSLIIRPVTATEAASTITESRTTMATSPTHSEATNGESRTILKPERRRKSLFAYRKDYDEVVITPNAWQTNGFESTDVTVTKLDHSTINGTSKCDDGLLQIVNDKPDINMNDGFDVKKILVWENGVGTLPGSDLKFHINEFGILEYIKKEELNVVIEVKKTTPPPKERRGELQEELRCRHCGCYGQPSEFLNAEYCGKECKESGDKVTKERDVKDPLKLKRGKKREWLKRAETGIKVEVKSEKDASGSEDDDTTSNTTNSQDKFAYPWHCSKKGFSWAKYLDHIKAKAAPVKLFKDPFPYNRNGFRPLMKLEGIDPQHPSYFCVMSVAEVLGYRIRLHFDGYPDNYDFWINADSMDIFPAGWCEKYGHVLHPPPGYTVEEFNWNVYLKSTRSTMAPKHLFSNRAGNAICPNGFRVGMKLEAIDKKNTSLVCVATIVDMMDNRFLVHFDSWDDIYDYWADPTSPYIHQVGWCEQTNHKLTPPSGYPNPETFTWDKYLKETKTVAAPVRAFKQKPPCGFRKGMRLECVDRRVPQVIRVATVDEVRAHQIRIKFDGWPDKYAYWVESDSIDIHPVGWCQKTGHPIEPPLTPNDVYDFLECPTVGCKGQGHTRGPKFSTHSSPKYCPYAEENLDCDRILPDRLLSPQRQPEAVVPVTIEPKDKPRTKITRPVVKIKSEPSSPIEIPDSGDEIEMKEIKPSVSVLKRKFEQAFNFTNLSQSVPIPNGYSSPYAEQIWKKYSKTLMRVVNMCKDPRTWSEHDVQQFISSLSYAADSADMFKKHNIDGESLLMLSQQDIVDVLGIKLGPAIKLYSTILLLRRHVV